jgi:transcription elongation factor Elf1
MSERCPRCKRLCGIIGIKNQLNPITKASVIRKYKCGNCNLEFELEGWEENNPSHRYSFIWERKDEYDSEKML